MRFFLMFVIIFCGMISHAQITDFDSINFDLADSIAATYADYSLKDPEALAQLLTKGLPTDVEKFRVIFRWICNNIAYDVESYNELMEEQGKFKGQREKLIKWQEKFHTKLYKRVLEDKRALCSGYSMIFERMTKSVGLTCETIQGYARNYNSRIGTLSLNHSWNAVQIGIKWYLVDATWASGIVNESVTRYTRRFEEDYFLTDPFYFLAGHYPAKDSWTLLYNKPSLTEFKKSSIKSTGFIRYKINQSYPENGMLKVKLNTPVDFRFTSNNPKCPKEVLVEVLDNKNYSDFRYPLTNNAAGELCFTHTFTQKGYYRIMIYVGRKLTFVYEATVS